MSQNIYPQKKRADRDRKQRRGRDKSNTEHRAGQGRAEQSRAEQKVGQESVEGRVGPIMGYPLVAKENKKKCSQAMTLLHTRQSRRILMKDFDRQSELRCEYTGIQKVISKTESKA